MKDIKFFRKILNLRVRKFMAGTTGNMPCQTTVLGTETRVLSLRTIRSRWGARDDAVFDC